ncbi:hypothetical protein HMPREF0645_2661 [Hallella bergensis DSM 17361]|uniref:Uncharacterized protein n=1 Tax=Hallella bergensis DSM 17361 TaxID=585502 RepID=D1Q0C6_9BACT|nr:hypothetical protein [Hallella bergensis]EFA42911.1 hypothetical protein HMPREF0645_2661 [Hallella bergensis DSM 17361]
MEQIIETIKRIEKARTALRQAIVDNELATSPRLKDLALIPKIYEIFKGIKGDDITVNDRKEFIFVAIYLYSPNKFFGGKMPKGLRNAIAKTTGVYSVTSISNNCTELLILYTTYDDFRHNVDTLLNEVMERLGK